MNAVIEAGFDYTLVDEIARDDVRDAAVRIKVRMARTAADIIEIGRELITVKETLAHGQFLNWIEAEFGMSRFTADRFMNVASRLGDKSSTVQHLQPTALYLLSAPSTDDEIVEEAVERAADGETVTAADIKALKEEWAAEKKDLKRQLDETKDKAKDAKATERDVQEQLAALQRDLAALRDERDTLKYEIERNRIALALPAPEAQP